MSYTNFTNFTNFKQFTNSIKKESMPEIILSLLFVIYLIFGGNTLPNYITNLTDNTYGKIVIIIISLSLFAYSNPIIGILGLLVAYKLMHVQPSSVDLDKYNETQSSTWFPVNTNTTHIPYTLEQEVVKKMTLSKFNQDYEKNSWKPVLDDTHDAAHLQNIY
jgi:hypothetical protein